MAKSIALPTDRQAVGQLLARLLREFRHDLAAPRAEAGFGDIRDPHMQIFGNVRMGGVRLTELADRAQLSLAATSELVNDLEEMGYLVRRPDPADGRAKLIDLTERGRDAMFAAGHRVADIEQRWSKLVGTKDFGHMCRTMQRLLDELDPQESRS
jgi:DNA-binding MarR family transcriptional regulator